MILQDLGSPLWSSALVERIRHSGPGRASAGEWLKFILAAGEHGVSKDEIKFSGVAHHLLAQPAEGTVVSRKQVLASLTLQTLMPRLQRMEDDSFRPTNRWAECAEPISPNQYAKRGLLGRWPDARYVARYRHRSLGWLVVLARYSDLLHSERKWWLVLNPKGARAAEQPDYGFASAPDAMSYAAQQMQRQFTKSARARHAPLWERFSLHGLGPYAELLITLPSWRGNFFSPVHFPGVRNLLVHLRTNVCVAGCGRRILFLDEVQSDWHAALAKTAPTDAEDGVESKVPDVPFAREWPLLTMKIALWWAGRQGLAGVAWSSPDLHQRRWQGLGPPTEVYRRGLPEAAERLSRVLPLELGRGRLLRRRIQPADKPPQVWRVLNAAGIPTCRPFAAREQADRFADLTGAVDQHEVPILWLPGDQPLTRMPLFGLADASLWQAEPKLLGPDPVVAAGKNGSRGILTEPGAGGYPAGV